MNANRPRIVVGIDGSEQARHALEWAGDYAHATGGALHVVAAWDWPTVQGVPVTMGPNDPIRSSEYAARRAVADLPETPDEVDIAVRRGHAARVLLTEAADADLLVVGCRGAGAFSRFLLGSVSSKCAAYSPVPVVIVRDAPVPPARRGVLVGIDDSPHAVAALRWSMDYADLVGEPLTVVTCVNPPPVTPVGYGISEPFPSGAVVDKLDEWLRDAVAKEEADRGRPVAAGVMKAVQVGPAAEVLTERSATASVTVVGRRGSGGFRRLLIGSVSSALAHHGAGTIVITPPQR